jgi:hypothetical protein
MDIFIFPTKPKKIPFVLSALNQKAFFITKFGRSRGYELLLASPFMVSLMGGKSFFGVS